METTNSLLDMLKEKLALPSDYALSKRLGVRPSCISNYRAGMSHLGQDKAILAAALLEFDPAYILACVEAERGQNEAIKKAWAELAGRLERCRARTKKGPVKTGPHKTHSAPISCAP